MKEKDLEKDMEIKERFFRNFKNSRLSDFESKCFSNMIRIYCKLIEFKFYLDLASLESV